MGNGTGKPDSETMKRFYQGSDTFLHALMHLTPPLQEYLKAEEEFLRQHMQPGTKVLDAGCGDMREGDLLETIVGEKGIIVGVDYSLPFLQRAKPHQTMYGNMLLVHGDVAGLPFLEETFDYSTLLFNTFGNLGECKEGALHEIGRVVKVGGEVLISTYSEHSVEARVADYNQNCRVTRVEGLKVFTDVGFVSEGFHPGQLHEFLQRAGFRSEVYPLTDIAYMAVGIKEERT